MRERLEGIKNKSILTPPLLPYPLKVGAIGELQGKKHHCAQVIGPKEAIVDCGRTVLDGRNYKSYRFTVLVRGVDTSGMADNEAIELPQVFEVTGNYTYETALGTSRTLLVIEPFNVKAAESSGEE